MSISGVILAAGQGTRMKSSLPKVLHNVLGIPMIDYAQEAISHFDKKYVVVGHQSEKVTSTLSETFIPVIQKEQLGTGHAISTLLESSEFDSDQSQYLVVIPGDVPLIRKEDIDKIYSWQKRMKSKDPFGDFDLIFSAAYSGNKILEYPVHYRARVYGETQISRFRDGYKLIIYFLESFYYFNFSK